MVKRYTIFIAFLFLSLFLFAGKIKKGFQSLDIYNYFEAKRLFEKGMKKDPVAASYGLSIIYLRDDNPFFNLDSAHSYICIATENYGTVTPKKKLKYDALKADSLSIFEHRQEVSNALYTRTKLNHTIASYQRFLDKNPWSIHTDSVIYFRDHLAFDKATEENTSQGFTRFAQTYPESELKQEAISAYERLNYQEHTVNNNFIDYVSFVNDFPESPYRADAEDQIYSIYTHTASLESYKSFIATYPNNRNVPQAWKKMFNTYLQEEYSTNSIQAFMAEFEDYPFKDELIEQLNRVDRVLYPIKYRNKWGFKDETGEFYINPQYDGAESFYEGLAIVSLEGKYGFADKTGELVIDAIFDDAYQMNEGHAVVEIDGGWGLINRSGEFVIQPEYDDLGNLTEGLAYYSEGDLYGYFDQKGIVRLKQQYTSANDFEAGKAIVSKQGNYGLIDVFGTTTIPFKYERLRKYGANVYAARFGGKWGLITEKGDSLMPFEYDFIGEMHDGRAIVEKDDMFNYISNSGEEMLAEWMETYPEYRQLGVFENGYARIEFDNGYNLIDTTGKKLFVYNKEDIGYYSDYIAIKKGEKWGFVNKNGAVVIGYNYTSAESFEGKIAKAGGAPLVGIIDKRGNYILEPFYEKIEVLNDTALIVKSRGHYGLMLTSGDTLLNFSYISVEPWSETVVQLETKEEVYYYHLQTKQFIRKEEE